MTAKSNENYTAKEIARRRDDALKRMLSTPPKPHSEMKKGPAKRKPKTQAKTKKA